MKLSLIGNNLTSLILAYILAKKKIDVEIYYLNSSKQHFKTRSLGISKYNLNYLSGFFKNIKKKTNTINEIKVLINNGKINKEIIFNENSKPLFNIIKYDELVSYVKSKVSKNNYISFKKLKNDKHLLNIVNNKNFGLVINCESLNILTKKFLKLKIYKNYNNVAFTTIINHSKLKNKIATQIFTEHGPLAFLPLSEKSTSIVFSFENKNKAISQNEIINKIKELNTLYKITSFEKIEQFNLNMKLPKKYIYNNILFFGDSIHSIHPLAGQGFNMTVRDIIELDRVIDKKINLGLEIDKSIFKEFEHISKGYNSSFSFGIDFIHEFFKFNKNYVPKNISEKFFSIINKSKKIKSIGIKIANEGAL